MLRVILALALMTSLAACGTRLNPFNWFGEGREERVRVSETILKTRLIVGSWSAKWWRFPSTPRHKA